MRRLLFLGLALFLFGTAGGVWLTRPETVNPAQFAALSGDPGRGEVIYWAGGCGSCHAAEGDSEKLTLSGGHRLVSDFGTFVAPNISPGQAGLGDWTLIDFANAMRYGTSPDGGHYYPAFPFASYVRMTDQDIADLWAFLQTLPVSPRPNEPHDLRFPYGVRAAVGAWKFLYLDATHIRPADENERGRYLVEALGHCGECHTPRTALGGLDLSRWMAGAPHPSGKGRIPGLTPAQLDWSATDIAYYLETGFTPDFDSAGGEMADVVSNTARLTDADREAIAAYLKALPPVE